MLNPIEDRVVVKLSKEVEKTTSSGLVLQIDKDDKPQEAVVVALGPGITLPSGVQVSLDLKVGDKVVFAKYSGTEIDHDGESYIILPYRDIYAVISGE
jgi:chaperonin GroES